MSSITISSGEGRRQAYLAALGIPLWTARQELPNAAPAASLAYAAYLYDEATFVEEPLQIESAQAEPVTPAAWPDPEPAVALVRETPAAPPVMAPPAFDDGPPPEAYLDDPEYQQAAIIDGLKKAAPMPAAAPVREPAPTSSATAEPPISFRIGVYACGAWQVIVPRPQLLSPSERALLQNIQHALLAEPPPALQFNWPMVTNYALPRHKKAAREALIAFFRNQALSEHGYVLLAEHEDELADLLAASTALPVRVQPGLASLLQQPMLKKALWRTLCS